MKILVACEYSAIVRDAFRSKGHDAWSCDILPTEGDPRWHIQGDVLDVLGNGWDMMIAHPPCTYLTIAGASKYKDADRVVLRDSAVSFFIRLQNAPIDKIAIENPIPFNCVQDRIGKYDQYVNPFDFGVPERKRICLWLKGLPALKSTNIVNAPIKKTYIRKTGPKAGRPYHTYYHQGKSAKERARFFPCIAEAMAEQWGSLGVHDIEAAQ